MRPLTERQQETLEFVRHYIRTHSVAPSRAEIAHALGLKHRSTAEVHLLALMKKGWIELKPASPRYVRLLDDNVPIVPAGRIAAGEPILAVERVLDHMPRTVAERFRPRADYFLEVSGDSMNRIGLVSGDIVAVHANPAPENGQIVVARLDDEVTLKRFKRIDERQISLSPESTNEAHQRRIVDLAQTDLHIDGVMVGALIGARSNKSESTQSGP